MSQEYFDRVAPDWERIRSALFPDAVRDKAIEAAAVRPGDVAADVGAGTGFMTEALRRRGVHVIAVDQSETMLAEMRRRLGTDPGIEYRPVRGERLPIDAETVDRAFANMYLHHVEDPAAAIAEIARTVRPGGMVLITDLDEHRYEFLRREHHDRWLGFKSADVHAWLEAAGLRDVSVSPLRESCSSSPAGDDRVAEVGIFMALGRK